MKKTLTFAMIKPDAIRAGNAGAIITMIENAGFSISALELKNLKEAEAATFYEIHKERPFYADMCKRIAAGPVIAMALQRVDAVSEMRKLIGATNPKDAVAGTVRHQFGASIDENAIHASDSDDNAAIEAKFFFSYLT